MKRTALGLVRHGIKERRGFLLCQISVNFGVEAVELRYSKKVPLSYGGIAGFGPYRSIRSENVIWLDDADFYKKWFELTESVHEDNRYAGSINKKIPYFAINLYTGKIICYNYLPPGLPNPIEDFSLVTCKLVRARKLES